MTLATATAPRTRPEPARVLFPVDVDAGVDAGSMLVALHERVERQFQAYEDAHGSHARQHRALGAITQALATHVAVEDELLYPAVADHDGRHHDEIARQLQQDHLLDLLLVELGGMIPSDRGFDAKVRVLMQVFRQHARDAETLIGQYMSSELDRDEREQLGLRMLERIGQLEGRPRRGW
jgi:Hemerythrin HHE cation binding domain